ncbi:MAG: hypothetical protein ACOYL6_10740 [Bacteriovoracaceae bacterium]
MLKASNLEQFKPRNPYKNAQAAKEALDGAVTPKNVSSDPSKVLDSNSLAAKDVPGKEAYDVNLSEEAKSKSLETTKSSVDSKSTDSKLPDLKKVKPGIPDFKPRATDLSHLQSLKDGSKDPKKEISDTKKTSALLADKKGTIKKPGIFFLPGMEIFSNSSSGRYDGIRKMAESVTGARLYGWDQKEDVINEIKKLHPDQPVVLVGHSLGGDTAHEIAEDLNEVENGFRKVDLLVTIDSVGYDNNIVPANVKRNLNIFGEKDFLFNDGPHAAREAAKTKVLNILRPESHTEIDDKKEVQRDIIDAIQEVLKGKSLGVDHGEKAPKKEKSEIKTDKNEQSIVSADEADDEESNVTEIKIILEVN